jgi:hypothetical protein
MADVPDLMDQSGRMKRLVLAATAGVIAAGAAYGLFYGLARPDDVSAAKQMGENITRYGGGAWKFVFYFTGIAGIVTFMVVLAIANRAAKKAYERGLTPQATAREK